MKPTSITLYLALAIVVTQMACQSMAGKMASDIRDIDIEAEKAAIREVVAAETWAYYQQDFTSWKNTYVNAPYFRMYGYWEGYPEKVKYHNGFESLQTVKQEQFQQNRTLWQGSIEESTNENFRIYPEVAWYTFDQVSYDKATRKLLGRSLETRILEKHNGQWKIAYLGFHYFPGEADHS